jgi:hypothetical protein
MGYYCLGCVINDASKLVQLTKYLEYETKFTKIYVRIIYLLKVTVFLLAIKALINFKDLNYHCFTFGDVNIVPTIEEYGVLTDFSKDVYKVYFHQIIDNIVEELVKLLGISQMN